MFIWMSYMTNKTALEVIGCHLGSGVRNDHILRWDIQFVWMSYMTNKTALEVIGCYLGSGVRNGHTEEGC